MNSVVVKKLVVGMLGTNCYIVYNENSKIGVCIDPGGHEAAIIDFLKSEHIIIQGILLTHGHFDHIDALTAVRKFSKAPVYISEKEQDLLLKPEKNLSEQFGRQFSFSAEHYLTDKKEFEIGEITFQLLWTPGHTEGSACFYIKKENILFSGDTLFANSVGRTDLPTGDMKELYHSIKNKLFLLPDITKVYPGHGDATNIDYEKKYNTGV